MKEILLNYRSNSSKLNPSIKITYFIINKVKKVYQEYFKAKLISYKIFFIILVIYLFGEILQFHDYIVQEDLVKKYKFS